MVGTKRKASKGVQIVQNDGVTKVGEVPDWREIWRRGEPQTAVVAAAKLKLSWGTLLTGFLRATHHPDYTL